MSRNLAHRKTLTSAAKQFHFCCAGHAVLLIQENKDQKSIKNFFIAHVVSVPTSWCFQLDKQKCSFDLPLFTNDSPMMLVVILLIKRSLMFFCKRGKILDLITINLATEGG